MNDLGYRLEKMHPRSVPLLNEAVGKLAAEDVTVMPMLINLEDLNKDTPLSLSDFVATYLVRTDGNLRRALYYASKNLRYLTRDFFSKLYDSYSFLHNQTADLLRKGIIDEVSVFTPFNMLDVEEPLFYDSTGQKSGINYDFSLPNQLGILYHALHLAALSSDFSPEALNYLVSGEYFGYMGEQGLAKIVADTRVLANLGRVRNIMDRYRRSSDISSDFYPIRKGYY